MKHFPVLLPSPSEHQLSGGLVSEDGTCYSQAGIPQDVGTGTEAWEPCRRPPAARGLWDRRARVCGPGWGEPGRAAVLGVSRFLSQQALPGTCPAPSCRAGTWLSRARAGQAAWGPQSHKPRGAASLHADSQLVLVPRR